MHDEADALGSDASIFWLGKIQHADLLAESASLVHALDVDTTATVFVGEDGEDFVAESYSAHGRRISFCGHGALAAAWFTFKTRGPLEEPLSFKNKERTWQATRVPTSEDRIALRYVCPELQIVAVPLFAGPCLRIAPERAALAGGSTDYLILELPSAEDVAALKPDFEAICRATERALIVTAGIHGSSGDQVIGCVYRYFAPQYGDPEDAATGSAAVQLAPYWAPRITAPTFQARQLSGQGAVTQLALIDGKVELIARVGYG
jgi:predicted PhzF superfamily epimerase YddE/YHI9